MRYALKIRHMAMLNTAATGRKIWSGIYGQRVRGFSVKVIETEFCLTIKK